MTIPATLRGSKGNLIRELRIQRSLSQETVAKKAQMSVSQLSRIECGKVQPSRGTLKKLAPVLGVTPAYFDAELLGEVVAERATDPDTRAFFERVLSLHDRIAVMSAKQRERLFQALDRIGRGRLR